MRAARREQGRRTSRLLIFAMLAVAPAMQCGCNHLPAPSEPHLPSKEKVTPEWSRMKPEPAEHPSR